MPIAILIAGLLVAWKLARLIGLVVIFALVVLLVNGAPPPFEGVGNAFGLSDAARTAGIWLSRGNQ